MQSAVAFARRTSLGDPAFVAGQEPRIKDLVSKAFAEETAQKITDVSTSRLLITKHC